MKKFWSLLCVCAMILCMIPTIAITASAAETSVITVETVKKTPLKAGDTFQVKLSTGRASRIAAVELHLIYDNTKLQAMQNDAQTMSPASGWLSEMEMKTIYCAPLEAEYGMPNMGEVRVTGMTLEEKDSINGEVFATITFKALKDITGDVPLTAFGNNNMLINSNYQKHPLSIVNGGLKIEFTDVKEGSWYYDAVRYVAAKGFITGYTNGTFRPMNDMQRQDFVVVLSRIAGADLSAYKNQTGGFADVKKGSYYAAAVAWAVDNGIVTGFNSTRFGVGQPLTREQVCTILYRYKGSPAVSNVDATLSQFPDKAKINAYAKKAAAWAVKNEVITGKGGKFAPQDNATRAQIATIMMRMDQKGMF